MKKRTCPACRTEKPASEFNKSISTGDGLQTQCRKCGAASSKRWYDNNPAKVKEGRRVAHLKHYGLTVKQYDQMLKDQMGLCAICLEKPRDKRGFHVDHDHSCCPEQARSCGKCVRGLLCGRCSPMLGMAADKVEILADAIVYLLDWENNQLDGRSF